MKLKIEIEMDNAAFEEDPSEEAGRILERYVERLRLGGGLPKVGGGLDTDLLRDINGNTCGSAWVEE